MAQFSLQIGQQIERTGMYGSNIVVMRENSGVEPVTVEAEDPSKPREIVNTVSCRRFFPLPKSFLRAPRYGDCNAHEVDIVPTAHLAGRQLSFNIIVDFGKEFELHSEGRRQQHP